MIIYNKKYILTTFHSQSLNIKLDVEITLKLSVKVRMWFLWFLW